MRKVDIVNWESDAWNQASSEFKADGIPLLAVFDGRGVFRGTVAAHLPYIEQAIIQAGRE